MLEIKSDTLTEAEKLAETLILDLKNHNYGYAFPKLIGGDISKAIRHGENGLLVTPGDHKELAASLSRLLSNDRFRAEIAVKGRNTVRKNFTDNAMTHAYCKIYDDLLR